MFGYTIKLLIYKNSLRSAQHDVCVWIYNKSFTIKNSLRRAEHDVCVCINDKTVTLKNHCGVRSTTCLFGYTINVLL